MSSLEEHLEEQARITAEWEERHAPYLPRPHAEDAPLWYVTMIWDNWPEGGSFCTTLRADTQEDAEHNTRWKMASHRREHGPYEDEAEVIETWGDKWELVACFELAPFIAMHAPDALAHAGDEIHVVAVASGSADALKESVARLGGRLLCEPDPEPEASIEEPAP